MKIKDERLLEVTLTEKEINFVDSILAEIFDKLGDEVPNSVIGQFFADIYVREKKSDLTDENNNLVTTIYHY